jgi:snurportin-1
LILGQRCTLSTSDNKNHKTFLHYKNGSRVFKELESNIPPSTVLDCVYVEANRSVFILDVISYDGREVSGCDTAFRFFWIKCKFEEDNLQFEKSTQLSIHLIETYDCSDSYSIRNVVEKCPIFNLGVKLDGYLFYHKEASYTPGESPLVLWLFPFMFEELFDDFKVHPFYHSERPKDYTNYLKYIDDFNEKALNRKRKNSKKKHEVDSSMEAEFEVLQDSSETEQNEHEMMMQLEMTGNDV